MSDYNVFMLNILSYFKSAPTLTTWHSHPGIKSRVLITAGIDGDEYAGIAAANKLIKTYKGKIPITIIPIVNISGNNAGVSWNPFDNRFPKHIFPGSKLGSSSSRLMNQISEVTQGKELWIDLHGGSTDEHLNPFIWTSYPYNFLTRLTGTTVVETITTLVPPRGLKKQKTKYVLLESGELGKVTDNAVKTHLVWVDIILNNLDKPGIPNWRPTYNTVSYHKFSNQDINDKNLLWYSPTNYVSGKITT